MPMLFVACSRCRFLIPTGVHMDKESFEEAQADERLEHQVARCPNCGNIQRWSKKDVAPASWS